MFCPKLFVVHIEAYGRSLESASQGKAVPFRSTVCSNTRPNLLYRKRMKYSIPLSVRELSSLVSPHQGGHANNKHVTCGFGTPCRVCPNRCICVCSHYSSFSPVVQKITHYSFKVAIPTHVYTKRFRCTERRTLSNSVGSKSTAPTRA